MSHTVPAGYISLKDAFDWHLARRPVESQDLVLAEVTEPFLAGTLTAQAELPGGSGYQELPISKLRPVLDQAFLDEKVIVTGLTDQWTTFEGCTPFVEEASFRQWSESVTEAEVQALDAFYVPENSQIWNLAMAVAWIRNRTMSMVREQWPEYRAQRHGEWAGGKLSLLWTAETSKKLSGAMRALFATAQQGDIKIFGVDQNSGERVAIPYLSLPNLSLAGDSNLADRLDQKGSEGNCRYRDLSVNSAQILELWPSEGGKSPPVSGPGPRCTEPQSNRTRRSPQQERVKPILKELYPDGIPSRDKLADGELIQQVSSHMDELAKKKPGLAGAPSPETILRAAGRKD